MAGDVYADPCCSSVQGHALGTSAPGVQLGFRGFNPQCTPFNMAIMILQVNTHYTSGCVCGVCEFLTEERLQGLVGCWQRMHSVFSTCFVPTI